MAVPSDSLSMRLALVQWLWEETDVPKVVGSNPCTMDGLFYIYICRKSCNVCLKRPKINEKEARIGPFLKKNHSSFSQSANQIRFICFKYRKDLSQFQCIIFMPNFRGGGLRMLNIALTHSQCDIICQNFATVVKFTSLCAIF